MLEYDNSAFYYFALTLLTIYIIPGTWYAISEFFQAFFGSGEVGAKARTKEEEEKAKTLKQQTTGWNRLNTTSYLANLCFLLFAWTLVIYLITLVKNDGEVSSFDPYQILQIEQDATVAIIKKAYRNLSLKYHPDKNPGNKVAEEMFMKVAKAYEALTDETSKENYQKYGNPDGKQSLEVSIGLPKLLLENPKIVLVLYLIAMVVIIPSAVGYWYANSKQFGEKNILYDTYNTFYSLLQESHRLKNLPEILATSAEFRNINSNYLKSKAGKKTTPTNTSSNDDPNSTTMEIDDETKAIFQSLYEKYRREKLMLKPKYEAPRVLYGTLLLHYHLLRIQDLPLSSLIQSKLQDMLRRAPELIDGLIDIALHRRWLDTSISTVKLSQCLIQALFPTTSTITLLELAFKQLPGLSTAKEKITKLIQENKIQTFKDFLILSDEEKLTKLGFNKNNSESKEFLQITNHIFPRLKIETKLFVEEDDEDDDTINSEDEDNNNNNNKKKKPSTTTSSTATANATTEEVEDEVRGDVIYEQDLVTLRVTLTRENLLTKQQQLQLQGKSTANNNNNNQDKKKKKKGGDNNNNNKKGARNEDEVAGPVYAPFFPATVYEGWWLVLTDRVTTSEAVTTTTNAANTNPLGGADQIGIHAFEKISDQHRIVTHEIRFLAPAKAGHYEYQLQILSDCYLGLDESFVISFDVRAASELPVYKPHQEDIDLDNEPTLFEQMVAQNLDESSEEDEDDEDEDDGEDDDDGHGHGPGHHHHNHARKNTANNSNKKKNSKNNDSKKAAATTSTKTIAAPITSTPTVKPVDDTKKSPAIVAETTTPAATAANTNTTATTTTTSTTKKAKASGKKKKGKVVVEEEVEEDED
jgi:translocation protein SEC63